MDIPAGYRPLDREASFWKLIGPLYEKPVDDGIALGLRVQEKHGNMRSVTHGGVICTLADIALGLNVARKLSEPMPIATVNLTTDFAGAAQIGDWLEARVDVQRTGRRLTFANCYIYVGEKRIARISGIFSTLG